MAGTPGNEAPMTEYVGLRHATLKLNFQHSPPDIDMSQATHREATPKPKQTNQNTKRAESTIPIRNTKLNHTLAQPEHHRAHQHQLDEHADALLRTSGDQTRARSMAQ
jgi:hypothetical protein